MSHMPLRPVAPLTARTAVVSAFVAMFSAGSRGTLHA